MESRILFWLSLAMLVLLGACDNISVVVRVTLVQVMTPDEMRGRVSALNALFIGTSNELGAVESGMVAGLFGPVFSVVSGGVGTILGRSRHRVSLASTSNIRPAVNRN